MHPVISRSSRCSTGQQPYQINDVIEAQLIRLEHHFNIAGQRPRISVLSGVWRMLFGTVEAVVAFFYALIKLFEAALTRACLGKHAAVLPALEALWGSTLIAHGVANVARGFFEMFQVGTRYNLGLEDHPFQYHTEGRNRLINPKEHRIVMDDETSDIVNEEYTPRGSFVSLPSLRTALPEMEAVEFGLEPVTTPNTQAAMARRERTRQNALAIQAIVASSDYTATEKFARVDALWGNGYQSASEDEGYAST